MKMTDEELKGYWASIPVGEGNAVGYSQLENEWGKGKRLVRMILSELGRHEHPEGYILIRSSKGSGFFLTKDKDTILAYKAECYSKGLSNLAPIAQINRFLKDSQDLKDYALKDLFSAID